MKIKYKEMVDSNGPTTYTKVDQTITCCQQMERRYGENFIIDDYSDDEPHLCYRNIKTDKIPVHYCPFCGVQIRVKFLGKYREVVEDVPVDG